MNDIHEILGWEPTFQEDFDKPCLNALYWSSICRSGKMESPHFVFGNSTLKLRIAEATPSRLSSKTPCVSGIATSSDLFGKSARNEKNRDRFSQLYGRFEMRAKCVRGSGMKCVFLLHQVNPTDREPVQDGEIRGLSGEPVKINIFEQRGICIAKDGTAKVDLYANFTERGHYLHPLECDPSADFHVWAMEWEENEIRWYIDDRLMETYHGPTPRRKMFLFAALVPSDDRMDENDPDKQDPAEFEIDWIRAYRKIPQRTREPKRLFSINCKVDSVARIPNEPADMEKALERFKMLNVNKVWLEVYRNRFEVPESALERWNRFLKEKGFCTGAVIVPSAMSDRQVKSWGSVTCFSDPSAGVRMRRCVEHAAHLFDSILFDDFLFTICTCDECERLRGSRSVSEFRASLTKKFILENIVIPAKKINSRIRLIIKYPCWYSNWFRNGYDPAGVIELFDATFAGTETRTGLGIPGAKAAWIQRWMTAIGKCGGGWFDSLNCDPQTYVEQARGTILGGADEVLFHCYDYLYPDAWTFAQDGGGLAIPKEDGCVRALTAELPGLRKLHEFMNGAEPFGVTDPRRPEEFSGCDGEIEPWFAMTGIPVVPEVSPSGARSFILCDGVTGFGAFREMIPDPDKTPCYMTGNAAKRLGVTDRAHILPVENGSELPGLAELDRIRNELIAPFGFRFHTPGNVSLNLYRKNERTMAAIQNFNDEPVKFCFENFPTDEILLALPKPDSAKKEAHGVFQLMPHSLLLI